MKTRIISAGIGLCILAVVLFFYETWVLNIAISLISLMAVYEVLHAINILENKALSGLCLVVAGVLPFMKTDVMIYIFPLFCLVVIFTSFIILLKTHDHTSVNQMAMADVMTLGITFSLCTILYLRDDLGMVSGIFYLVIMLGGGWLTDTGAYFAGRKFGKRKMAPRISPKKTVEGLIGGIVTCLVSYMVLGLLCIWVCGLFKIQVEINFIYLLILTPLAAFSGVLGDLSASIVKRQNDIKDFGKIMPGHGGVMDRFDSVFFVAPVVFLFVQVMPIIHIL